VIPRPVHVETGHSLGYPATIDLGVLIHDQVGPIMYRHVEKILQGRDVHIVLHEPDTRCCGSLW
jgi:hypothetical protein